MNVLVCTAGAPLVRDAIDDLCEHLVGAIIERGAQAESIRIPFRPSSVDDAVDELVLMRSLRIDNVDRVIALRFPVSIVQHAHKILWLHDSPLGKDTHFNEHAAPFRRAQERALSEAKRVYAATRVIGRSVSKAYGFENTILPDPTSDAEWRQTAECLLA